jgi:hypothetical protein
MTVYDGDCDCDGGGNGDAANVEGDLERLVRLCSTVVRCWGKACSRRLEDVAWTGAEATEGLESSLGIVVAAMSFRTSLEGSDSAVFDPLHLSCGKFPCPAKENQSEAPPVIWRKEHCCHCFHPRHFRPAENRAWTAGRYPADQRRFCGTGAWGTPLDWLTAWRPPRRNLPGGIERTRMALRNRVAVPSPPWSGPGEAAGPGLGVRPAPVQKARLEKPPDRSRTTYRSTHPPQYARPYSWRR